MKNLARFNQNIKSGGSCVFENIEMKSGVKVLLYLLFLEVFYSAWKPVQSKEAGKYK